MTNTQRNCQELTEKTTRVNNNDGEVHFCSFKTIKQRERKTMWSTQAGPKPLLKWSKNSVTRDASCSLPVCMGSPWLFYNLYFGGIWFEEYISNAITILSPFWKLVIFQGSVFSFQYLHFELSCQFRSIKEFFLYYTYK